MKPEPLILAVFLFALLFLLFGCVEKKQPYSDLNMQVAPKGDRLLGIDISTATGQDYDSAFALAKSAGLETVQLSLGWDDIEKARGQYANEFLWIANKYYSASGTKLALNINPIDTTRERLPAHLKGKRFDDLDFIESFNGMMDFVLSQLEDVQIVSLSIGNEIDVFLGDDNAIWEQYKNFFYATAEHARTKKTGLKVGAKATFRGLAEKNRNALEMLNKKSDVVLATYYPLNDDFTVKEPATVIQDFEELAGVYSGKQIFFLEAGYPSSSANNSSEQKQEEFVRNVFSAWDKNPGQIKLVNFLWLHDRTEAEIESFAGYYGVSSEKFKGFLRTLGLRTEEGKDKLAFLALKEEAGKRGWGKESSSVQPFAECRNCSKQAQEKTAEDLNKLIDENKLVPARGDGNRQSTSRISGFKDENSAAYYILVESGAERNGESVVKLSLRDVNGNVIDSGYFGKGDADFFKNGKRVASIYIDEIVKTIVAGTTHYSIRAYINVTN